MHPYLVLLSEEGTQTRSEGFQREYCVALGLLYWTIKCFICADVLGSDDRRAGVNFRHDSSTVGYFIGEREDREEVVVEGV